MANGRARALGFTEGQVKILADQKTDRIIGAHIVGPRASEILGEIVIAMEFGGSAEDLARSFHAHPTLNEVIREAALAVDKRARQI
jgi:dihydrolipoamide dehydrogenase